MLCTIGIYNGYSFFYFVFILRSPPVLLLYSWCFIPFHVLISLLLSIFSWIFLLLFGVHPPVSSCLIAVLLMFYSVSCVNFFTFIHIFVIFRLLFGVHPPVSSCLIAALLMFSSVSCVNFFNFIHIFVNIPPFIWCSSCGLLLSYCCAPDVFFRFMC